MRARWGLVALLCAGAVCAARKDQSTSHAPSPVVHGATSTQPGHHAHDDIPIASTASSLTAGSVISPQATDIPMVSADQRPYVLNDTVLVRSDLNLSDTSGLHFEFTHSLETPVHVSLSLCGGPSIPAYNTSNTTLLAQLGMNAAQARQATLVSMLVAHRTAQSSPGPHSNLPAAKTAYAQGGWAEIAVPKGKSDGLWISVYPPLDTRGLSGAFRTEIVASTRGTSADLRRQHGAHGDRARRVPR